MNWLAQILLILILALLFFTTDLAGVLVEAIRSFLELFIGLVQAVINGLTNI